MRGFKMMFGLGVALVLGLAGIGQARVEAPSGFLPLDWPESVDGVGVGSAMRTIPDPSHDRSAQRTLQDWGAIARVGRNSDRRFRHFGELVLGRITSGKNQGLI